MSNLYHELPRQYPEEYGSSLTNLGRSSLEIWVHCHHSAAQQAEINNNKNNNVRNSEAHIAHLDAHKEYYALRSSRVARVLYLEHHHLPYGSAKPQ
ncbi:hypothetical protein PG993_007718 [Apiospora rasikravindrae]|uniref:Uncharacterized protein n=1 Tax=Apiospora rasikravindrae TaxID=990691 RepID=A0ABR1SYN9_9PEZI